MVLHDPTVGPPKGIEVAVVSRDRNILDDLPSGIGITP